MSDEKELVDSKEAVEYLAKRWGKESYSLGAFRSLRFRYNLKPALATHSATFWRKSDLDKIPMPDRRKQRGKKRKGERPGEEGAQTHRWHASHSALQAVS